jgi:hypothetical protein
MKTKVLVLIVGLLLVGVNGFAADGDLIVNGKLGVGTSAGPAYKSDVRTPESTGAQLHIAATDTDAGCYVGSVNDTNTYIAGGGVYTGTEGWKAKGTSSGAYRIGTYGDLQFQADSSLTVGNTFTPTVRMKILASNGYVGIGSTNPGHLLEMEANAGGYYSTGDQGESQGWKDSSSIRWKSDFRPIANALDTVLKLNGVVFKWKKRTDIFETVRDGNEEVQKYVSSTWADDPKGRDNIGLIAEDVMKVLPEVVDADQKDPNFARGMSYSKIVAVLIEAIKEQQKEIEDLRTQVQKVIGR